MLELSIKYHQYLAGLESLFILGDFGVYNDAISAMPKTLRLGNICEQGLPNYSGNITYLYEKELKKQAGEAVFLNLGKWAGVAIGVKVNNSPVQIIGWNPYKLDISKYVKSGKNKIEITVFGSRRNSHGPFYIDNDTPAWCGPNELGRFMHSSRNLVSVGLLEEPFIQVKK